MELKLVYRALRKISDWTLSGFFSEVYVEGQGNVPKDGPLIIAASHHNEIIDIATLAATIPHRRHLSFWAKSTLFANPVARNILLSSGAIPVHRNPNNGGSPSDSTTASISAPSEKVRASPKSALFDETITCLSSGGAVGVFPEGTSYTQPSLAALREGAGWAAVEYLKWALATRKQGENNKEVRDLVIVPVGIVYTNKSRFRSRICVRYGTPITVSKFISELSEADGDDADNLSYQTVQKIMHEIDVQLLAMTINAPDWETLYAARMEREILFGEDISLQSFVRKSQQLIAHYSSDNSDRTRRLKAALNKYFALLHHTGIDHPSLASMFSVNVSELPSSTQALFTFTRQLLIVALNPFNFIWLPFTIPHIPGYVLAALAARFLATPGEEEGIAQFKSIFGGLGFGIGYAGVIWKLQSALTSLDVDKTPGLWNGFEWSFRLLSEPFTNCLKSAFARVNAERYLRAFGVALAGGNGLAQRVLATSGLVYGTAWILFRGHNAIVGANYKRFKLLMTAAKVLVGLLSPTSSDVGESDLRLLSLPPVPPPNRFIKHRTNLAGSADDFGKVTELESSRAKLPNVASRSLIRHLLRARMELLANLESYNDADE